MANMQEKLKDVLSAETRHAQKVEVTEGVLHGVKRLERLRDQPLVRQAAFQLL